MRKARERAAAEKLTSVMSAPTAEERHGARPPAVSSATFFGGFMMSVSWRRIWGTPVLLTMVAVG